MKNTTIEQMELGVRNQIRNGCRNVRPDRMKRARWWFGQMRRAVEVALPQPIGSPRPEQTYLKLSNNTDKV
jgi:hypothetical protein